MNPPHEFKDVKEIVSRLSKEKVFVSWCIGEGKRFIGGNSIAFENITVWGIEQKVEYPETIGVIYAYFVLPPSHKICEITDTAVRVQCFDSKGNMIGPMDNLLPESRDIPKELELVEIGHI